MKRLSKLLGLHVQYKCRLCGGKAVRSPAAMKSHRVGNKELRPQQGRRRFQRQRWGEQQQQRRGQPRADRRAATAAAGAGAAQCREIDR